MVGIIVLVVIFTVGAGLGWIIFGLKDPKSSESGEKKQTEVPYHDLDPGCEDLCRVLNGLKGIYTISSCCGHGERPFEVWFHCLNWYSLAVISRSIERVSWVMETKTIEQGVTGFPKVVFRIHSVHPIPEEDVTQFIQELINKLKETSDERYYEDLKYYRFG
ncbi:MAG: hypothetical protein J6I84_03515 [Bacilli bacterium]|nr:hypothetical protein [Bacilli bacterium]